MKDELQAIISGKNTVSNGAVIQSAACYLAASSNASRLAKSEKHYKAQETEALKKFIAEKKPDFQYTTIQVNKNVFCNPHVDKNNVGPSYIIALGDFTGGELVVEGTEFNIKNRWKKFDGRRAHWINPFKGTRYSLVFFTHTFKPPHPSVRSITVTKSHIYNKHGEIIKSW